MKPFDGGSSAARKGKPKSANPFNHPDRVVGEVRLQPDGRVEFSPGQKLVRADGVMLSANLAKLTYPAIFLEDGRYMIRPDYACAEPKY